MNLKFLNQLPSLIYKTSTTLKAIVLGSILTHSEWNTNVDSKKDYLVGNNSISGTI